MSIDAIKFGLAGGIISALFMFAVALIAGLGNYGTELINSMSSLYVGFAPGFIGGLIGGLWGFIEGFVCFYLIAWVYDKLLTTQKSA